MIVTSTTRETGEKMADRIGCHPQTEIVWPKGEISLVLLKIEFVFSFLVILSINKYIKERVSLSDYSKQYFYYFIKKQFVTRRVIVILQSTVDKDDWILSWSTTFAMIQQLNESVGYLNTTKYQSSVWDLDFGQLTELNRLSIMIIIYSPFYHHFGMRKRKITTTQSSQFLKIKKETVKETI